MRPVAAEAVSRAEGIRGIFFFQTMAGHAVAVHGLRKSRGHLIEALGRVTCQTDHGFFVAHHAGLEILLASIKVKGGEVFALFIVFETLVMTIGMEHGHGKLHIAVTGAADRVVVLRERKVMTLHTGLFFSH